MRDYLSESNLRKAAILGAVMALLSLPRMITAGVKLSVYAPAALFSMILISGAATAWSAKGGMIGLFPETRRMALGMAVGFALALFLLPICLAWVDPPLASAMAASGDARRLALHYPTTLTGRISLVLWVAGFETMFFQAGAMSLFSRLSGRAIVAIVVAVCLRVLVSASEIANLNLQSAAVSSLLSSAAISLISCVLFARAGLPGVMTFSATLASRVFFHPLG